MISYQIMLSQIILFVSLSAVCSLSFMHFQLQNTVATKIKKQNHNKSSLPSLCLPPRAKRKKKWSAKNVKFIPRKVTGYTGKFWQMQLYIEIHRSIS